MLLFCHCFCPLSCPSLCEKFPWYLQLSKGISSLSCSVVFFYLFALFTKEAFLSLLAIVELCIQVGVFFPFSFDFRFCTVLLISQASKVMLKIFIFQARLQHCMNQELPDVQAGFRKGRGTRDQIDNINWTIEKTKEFQKRHPLLRLWLH